MKNIFKLIIFILISLNFTACEEKEKVYATAEQTRAAYEKAVKEGYYDNVLPKFTDLPVPKQRDKEIQKMDLFTTRSQAVQYGKPEAATEIALAYYVKLKDYEKAVEWLIYSNSIKPTAKNSDTACAIFLEEEADLKEALKWCKQAVDLGSDETITGLGVAYNRNKDYESAIYWLKKGVELNQEKAATNLGVVYSKLSSIDNLNKMYLKEAEEWYLKAIKDFPKDTRSVSNLINFYHDTLKDNVRASAWAIAGIGNVFSAKSVAEIIVYKWRIPVEDIKKGYELQLTSDEFPYKYEEKERKLGILTQKGWYEFIELVDYQIEKGILDRKDYERK